MQGISTGHAYPEACISWFTNDRPKDVLLRVEPEFQRRRIATRLFPCMAQELVR